MSTSEQRARRAELATRRDARHFWRACAIGGTPAVEDFEAAGLPPSMHDAARKWVDLLHTTFDAGDHQRARELADTCADLFLKALAAGLPATPTGPAYTLESARALAALRPKA